ncbi:MAG: alpha/beta fold hydrolase, partial [Ilumatobacteraceae bacterium]
MNVPHWLPPGHVVSIPGRGEVFVRFHRHADPAAPVVLLLHGWTASSDTQFLFAYEQLCERYSVIGVDHHGHGRGFRSTEPFDLAAVADDSAFAVRSLGVERVVSVGYSMGGAINMWLVRRHRELVAGMVFEATALDWRSSRLERARWWFVPLLSPVVRAWWFARYVGRGLRVVVHHNHLIDQWMPWLTAEILRNDPRAVVSAGSGLRRHEASSLGGEDTGPSAWVRTPHDRLIH